MPTRELTGDLGEDAAALPPVTPAPAAAGLGGTASPPDERFGVAGLPTAFDAKLAALSERNDDLGALAGSFWVLRVLVPAALLVSMSGSRDTARRQLLGLAEAGGATRVSAASLEMCSRHRRTLASKSALRFLSSDCLENVPTPLIAAELLLLLLAACCGCSCAGRGLGFRVDAVVEERVRARLVACMLAAASLHPAASRLSSAGVTHAATRHGHLSFLFFSLPSQQNKYTTAACPPTREETQHTRRTPSHAGA